MIMTSKSKADGATVLDTLGTPAGDGYGNFIANISLLMTMTGIERARFLQTILRIVSCGFGTARHWILGMELSTSQLSTVPRSIPNWAGMGVKGKAW